MVDEEEQEQLPLFEPSESCPPPAVELQKSTKFSKYVVYVDESGDHSLTSIDKDYPVFVLAFCVFHKRHYSEFIVPAVEKLKFNYFGHDQIVLHEHEIRKSKNDFRILKNKPRRAEFFEQLNQVVEKSNFILMSCSIDKLRLPKQDAPENPYHVALRFCLDSLYELMEEKGEDDKETHVIFEARGEKENKELELEFRRICDGYNSRGIRLPFKILIKKKEVMSTGLQLADLVARPIGLRTIRPEQPNRTFPILEKKFYCKGGRCSVGQDFEGYGMKVFPGTKSEKPR